MIKKKAWILTTLSSFGGASEEADVEREEKEEEKNKNKACVNKQTLRKQLRIKVLKHRYLEK